MARQLSNTRSSVSPLASKKPGEVSHLPNNPVICLTTDRRNRLADEMFEQMHGERYDKVNSYFLGTVTEAYLSEVFC